jgi:cob(I)alamin adenosyltransferase
MPIYTGTGDAGDTGLFDNRRVGKDDLRIAAYGTVDELNSLVGLLRAEPLPAEFDAQLAQIQRTLFEFGADLATPGATAAVATAQRGRQDLERWIDQSEAALPPLRSFVLPAGHREAALCHLLRTTTRRAERLFWALHRRDTMATELGVYLNRLSDLFFSWARWCNLRHGVEDVPWISTER